MENLAIIFKLDVNQGIYICREEEGEIIIPTETGFFNVGDYSKTYVVNRVEKWGKNVQAERAFHFAPVLTAVNQGAFCFCRELFGFAVSFCFCRELLFLP